MDPEPPENGQAPAGPVAKVPWWDHALAGNPHAGMLDDCYDGIRNMYDVKVIGEEGEGQAPKAADANSGVSGRTHAALNEHSPNPTVQAASPAAAPSPSPHHTEAGVQPSPHQQSPSALPSVDRDAQQSMLDPHTQAQASMPAAVPLPASIAAVDGSQRTGSVAQAEHTDVPVPGSAGAGGADGAQPASAEMHHAGKSDHSGAGLRDHPQGFSEHDPAVSGAPGALEPQQVPRPLQDESAFAAGQPSMHSHESHQDIPGIHSFQESQPAASVSQQIEQSHDPLESVPGNGLAGGGLRSGVGDAAPALNQSGLLQHGLVSAAATQPQQDASFAALSHQLDSTRSDAAAAHPPGSEALLQSHTPRHQQLHHDAEFMAVSAVPAGGGMHADPAISMPAYQIDSAMPLHESLPHQVRLIHVCIYILVHHSTLGASISALSGRWGFRHHCGQSVPHCS